jgi:hypothetical protein
LFILTESNETIQQWPASPVVQQQQQQQQTTNNKQQTTAPK